MKQIWMVLCCVVILCVSTMNGVCGPVDTADIGDGFSGIKWGTTIDDLKNFEKAYTKDSVDFYLNPERQHYLEDGTPVAVVYGFFLNRLFAVYMGLNSRQAYDSVERYITEKYGNPDRQYLSKTEQTIKKWKYKDVKIKLKMKNASSKMKLAIYYLPLSTQVNEEQQEDFQKGRIEFLPTIKRNENPKGLFPLLSF